MPIENLTPLTLGNQAFRNKDYAAAIEQYLIALQQMPALGDVINTNIALARARLQLEESNAVQSVAATVAPIAKIAVVVHVYYLEIWPEIAQYLKSITYPFDLFVTTTTEQAGTVVPLLIAAFPKANIKIQPNNGMDVLPFLALIPMLINAGYVAVCKLHTKRGDGGEQGTSWRRALLDSLIGDNAVFTAVAQAFAQHTDLQLVGPASLYLSARKLMFNNELNIKQLFEQIEGRPLLEEDWGFFAGSIFWVRPTALQKLAQVVAYLQTQHSVEYQQDGQISHAVERLLGLLPVLNQGQVGLLQPAVASSAQRFVLQIVAAAQAPISQAELSELLPQYANLEVDLARLRESGGFDSEQYLAQHPGLVGLDVDLLAHYLLVGRFGGGGQAHHMSPAFEIFIDSITTNLIIGWCFARTSLINGIELHKNKIKINEALYGTLRTDVQKVFNVHCDKIGFQLEIPKYTLKINEWNVFELLDTESKCIICTIAIANRLFLPFLHNVIDPSRQLLYSEMLIKCTHTHDFWVSAWSKHSANNVPVDIIIPIYKGYVETVNCINSVIQAQTQIDLNILLINDATPDKKIAEFLHNIKNTDSRITLLINDNNLGFVRTVNRGFEHSKNDVVILNSDTEVFNGWIDRLQKCAYNKPNIGTVTPLSNNAEIFNISSVDKPFKIGSSEGKYLDSLLMQVGYTDPVDVPVGVGFCMYMKRACLDSVGLFNADEWGMGYGEEVDFCLRAMQKDWRNVAAPNIFVIHYGGVSFGKSKDQYIAEASKKIADKYPFYDRMIHEWVQVNPLRIVHNQMYLLLLSQTFGQAEFDVHISHALGGGTEKYIQMQIDLAKQRNVNVIRLYIKPNRIFSLEFIIHDLDEFTKRLLGEKLLLDFVEPDEICELKNSIFNSFKINSVYFHSLLFSSKRLIQELMNIVKSYKMVIHDYYLFCPRIHLYQNNGQYCKEPNASSCTQCLLRYPIHNGAKLLWSDLNQSYTQWLEFNQYFFKEAAQVICGSEDVKQRLVTHGFENDILVKCYDSFVSNLQLSQHRIKDFPKRIAMLGAISDIKGFYSLRELLILNKEKSYGFDFIVIGYTMNDAELLNIDDNLLITGQYQEPDFHELLLKTKIGLALFLGTIPETYSFTLSLCLEHSIYPIAMDIGAIAERIRANNFGELIPLNTSSEKILGIINNVIAKLLLRT